MRQNRGKAPTNQGYNAHRPGGKNPILVAFSLATTLFAGLLTFQATVETPSFAAEIVGECRAGQAANKTTNGSYTASGITIEPVFANRMYADFRAGYDAMYIAYRITYAGGAQDPNLTDVWITLDDWGASPAVKLARSRDGEQRIGQLNKGGTATTYFFVKASEYSSSNQTHTVRVWKNGYRSGTPVSCQTHIEGVQRSISARANQVTSIDADPPVLGSPLIITVKGNTGNVGQGNDFDKGAMTLSPATLSSWPTSALRLKSVRIDVVTQNSRVTGQSAATNCPGNAGVTGQGNTRTVRFDDRVVLRNFNACATNRSTYTATYTFDVVSSLSRNPRIVPVSDISSGTQMKYTGGYPSDTDEVIFVSDDGTLASVPQSIQDTTVSKTYSGPTNPPPAAVKVGDSFFVDLDYEITASKKPGTASANVVLDELWDYLPTSAVVTEAQLGGVTTVFSEESTPTGPLVRFLGPFTVSTNTPVTVTYTIRVPLVAGPNSNSYVNSAYGLFGNYTVGSGTNQVTQITLTLDATEEDDTLTTSNLETDTQLLGLPQEITFTPPSGLAEGESITLEATSDSGLPVEFRESDTSTCVVSEFDGVWTLTMVGTECVVIAFQDGGNGFDEATPVEREIAGLNPQTISREGAGTPAFGFTLPGKDASGTFTVSATSGRTVSVDEVSGICSLTGPTNGVYQVTAKEASGACVLIASEAGDGVEWGSAPDLTINIPIGSKTQSLSVIGLRTTDLEDNTTDQIKGTVSTTFLFTQSLDQNNQDTTLTVSLRSLTPTVCAIGTRALVEGESVSDYIGDRARTETQIIRRGSGTCTVEANQDGFSDTGDALFPPAQPITYSFSFLAKGTTPQFISFPNPPELAENSDVDTVYGSVLTVRATSLFGEPGTVTELIVGYRVTGSCEISSTTLHTDKSTTALLRLTEAGDCTITTFQSGNDTYGAASDVTKTITIGRRTVTVSGLSGDTRTYDGTDIATVSGAPVVNNVVPGDGPSQVSFDATSAVWRYDSPNVGESRGVSGQGFGLTGSKTDNYQLGTVTVSNGRITQRSITLTPAGQSIQVGSATPTTCDVTVTGDGLADGDEIDVTCSFGTYAQDEPVGEYTISISSETLTRAGQDVSGNYVFDLQTALLTVTAEAVPVLINLEAFEVVYGEELPASELNKPRVEDEESLPNGKEIVHKFGGTVLDSSSRIMVGVHTIAVELRSGNRVEASATRQLTVTKRPVTYFVPSPTKVYDGTETIPLGTFTLTGTEDGASGALTGDDVSLTGAPTTASFLSADVGDNRVITWTSPRLGGTKANNYQLVTRGQGAGSITKRPVTYSFAAPVQVYDGNDAVPLGAFSLVENGDPESGVIPGDDVTLTDVPTTGSFGGQTAVGTHTVTWQAPNLDGTKRGNYALGGPGAKTGTITKRPITLQVQTFTRLVGEPNPTFTLSTPPSGPGIGLAPGETVDTVLGGAPAISPAGLLGDQVGSFALDLDASNASNNYDLTTEAGTLYVADIQITVQQTNGVLSSRDVVCSCAGFQPNTTATVTIFSTPTQLATITVDGNGACPFATTVTIPASVPDGPHTIELAGAFPPGNAASKSVPVRLDTPTTGSQTPAGPPPIQPAPSAPRLAPPPPPFIVQPPIGPGPLVAAPPNQQIQQPPAVPPASSATNPPGPATPGALDNGPVSPLRELATRAGDASNTFDLGLEAQDPVPNGNGANVLRAGTRTMGQLQEEKLGGFDPSTALRVEVIGSRTTARFVLTSLVGIDQLVVMEQITRSATGNRENFAGLNRVSPGSPTASVGRWGIEERTAAADIFNYSRLDAPEKHDDLLGDDDYTWISLESSVSGYLPGSIIYLTATSSPIVFAEAVVGPDGQAMVTGDMAIELLGLGEHRVRVVGTRIFSDITVDAEGGVSLPPDVLAEIGLFDMGTDATVIVTGNNPAGGVHTVMRVVPLDPVSPWWTLWVIGWTALLLLLGRVRGMVRTVAEKSSASAALVVSAIPALYLGWTTTVTQVAWWGLLMGLGLSVLVWFVPALGRRRLTMAPSPPVLSQR